MKLNNDGTCSALKSSFLPFFTANSLAISSSLIVGERRRWLLYFFTANSWTGPTSPLEMKPEMKPETNT